MGVGLSGASAIQGSLVAAGLAAASIGKDLKKDNKELKVEEKDNKDIKMAQKARKQMQAKINAIYANKEISNKARTRRVGKVLDEYQKGGE